MASKTMMQQSARDGTPVNKLQSIEQDADQKRIDETEEKKKKEK